MTDLERLVHRIVNNVSASDPARLRRPVTLAELRDTIVPYRANRRALELETSEDYELVLLRFCAGEGGFARMQDREIGKEFADELQSPNPDLALLRRHEDAALNLDDRALQSVVSRDPHHSFAPREAVTAKDVAAKRRTKSPDAQPTTPAKCLRCRDDLPRGRVVNFCPHCGYDVRKGQCPQCNAELEPAWRHCISCGHTLNGA
jgi:double zinc ribbon protein